MMPKTMRGKVWFKKIFYGEMVELPPVLEEGVANYEAPKPIPGDWIDTLHTAIYALARPKQEH